MISDVTGVLLAGGKSKRMGKDKRFLSIGEETLFRRSCAALREVFERVYVVIAQDSPELPADVPVLRDLIPGCGSLGGLYTGLRHASTQHIFLAACDMPFLNSRLVQYMVERKPDADIVMARWKDRLQPTHAVYSQGCLPILAKMIETHDIKIQNLVVHPSLCVQLIEERDLRQIDSEGHSFLNINTPADLEAARLLVDHSLGS